MRLHLCRHPDNCDYCERRAELEADDLFSSHELDDLADYAAAKEHGGGHP